MREPITLESTLKQNRRDLDQLKGTQYVSLASVENHATFSVNDADYIIPFSDLTPSKLYRFTLDHSASDAGGLFMLKIYYVVFDSLTPGHGSPPLLSGGVLGNAYSYSAVVLGSRPWESKYVDIGWAEEMPPSIGNSTSWLFKVTNTTYDGSPPDPALNVFVKFIIDGTDTGIWSIDAL